MWGLLAYIYIWLVQMLWAVNPQAWLFLAAITTINLIFEVFSLASTPAVFNDVSASFILNGLILLDKKNQRNAAGFFIPRSVILTHQELVNI